MRSSTRTPRLKACLDVAAEKSGWGSPLPPRAGRGVAAQSVFGSYLASVAEVEVDAFGEVAVKRVVCAVDCGTVINPDTVAAQIEGGLIFGLSAALFSEITLAKGRVQQANFNNYRIMRITRRRGSRSISYRAAKRRAASASPARRSRSPALANAIFAATGVALARLASRPCGARREKGRMMRALQAVALAAIAVALFVVAGGCSGSCSRRGRPISPAATASRSPTIMAPIRPAFRRSSEARTSSGAAPIWPVRPTASPATRRRAVMPYAGGLAFVLPFGTLYSSNITPDKETGIGEYSDADFLGALHRGVGRGGKRLYPAMPYVSYTAMTDADALAIKAYLFSLAPISASLPPNTLAFPFNQRWVNVGLDASVQPGQAL